ncbi:hypothetical protein LCGC14_1996060, partial [marine sediment metagenome]
MCRLLCIALLILATTAPIQADQVANLKAQVAMLRKTVTDLRAKVQKLQAENDALRQPKKAIKAKPTARDTFTATLKKAIANINTAKATKATAFKAARPALRVTTIGRGNVIRLLSAQAQALGYKYPPIFSQKIIRKRRGGQTVERCWLFRYPRRGDAGYKDTRRGTPGTGRRELVRGASSRMV